MEIRQIHRAKRDKGFLPPSYNKGVRSLAGLLGKPYLKRGEHVSSLHMKESEHLCRALKDHQEGKYRLIILFRHADKADAPCLMHALNNRIAKEGRLYGIDLKQCHARFLYGKDVPNWAGKAAEWTFPRLGNIPVTNRGLCRESIQEIKKALKTNDFPLALAPEGQVTYHAHKTFDMERGIVHMADWAAEYGPVRILPVALAYDYAPHRERVMTYSAGKWKEYTGLSLSPWKPELSSTFLKEMTEKTITLLENHFRAVSTGSLDDRLAGLCDTILREGETLLGLKPAGTVLDRVFRLRYRGMKVYYPDSSDPADWSPLEAAGSAARCVRARLFIRCSQIVDVLEYVHTSYLTGEALGNRHCEYALNLLDVLGRFDGGGISGRQHPVMRKALLLSGEPLDPAAFHSIENKRARYSRLSEELKHRLQKLSGESESFLA